MKLLITSSPHIFNRRNSTGIMYTVILALLPVVLTSVYFFGLNAARLILTCITGAVLTEFIFQKLRRKKVTINDGSAIISGTLLALVLPPGLPSWMALLGSMFAIAIGKQFFGGLGHNIFNPAMLGRAFLMTTFPVSMTTWLEPFTLGAISKATPLALIKSGGELPGKFDLLTGSVSGSLGATSAIAIILGGLILYLTRTIDWRIPAGFIGTVFAIATAAWMVNPDKFVNPVFHVLSGGLLLGAIFMATDYVTTPVTKKGRWIFAIGCGIIVMFIRLKSVLPEGVMYSILLMNALTPLINRITVQKVFGH